MVRRSAENLRGPRITQEHRHLRLLQLPRQANFHLRERFFRQLSPVWSCGFRQRIDRTVLRVNSLALSRPCKRWLTIQGCLNHWKRTRSLMVLWSSKRKKPARGLPGFQPYFLYILLKLCKYLFWVVPKATMFFTSKFWWCLLTPRKHNYQVVLPQHTRTKMAKHWRNMVRNNNHVTYCHLGNTKNNSTWINTFNPQRPQAAHSLTSISPLRWVPTARANPQLRGCFGASKHFKTQAFGMRGNWKSLKLAKPTWLISDLHHHPSSSIRFYPRFSWVPISPKV